MGLSVRQTGPADLKVLDDTGEIAEIRDLKLTFARFQPGGRLLINETYPLFLYWMQYANHEDPERNAGSGGRVEIVTQSPNQIVLKCSGTTASGGCLSSVLLTIRRDEPVHYVYSVRAAFDVVTKKGWLVTPNPTHGEVEFANVWPDDAFSSNPDGPKRYQACFVSTSNSVERIPHHHLETSDKHNIMMNRGDRFLWLREEENPCLTVLSEKHVTAGICAYMWDAHFAYKICDGGKDVVLPAGWHVEAEYELTSLDRNEAQAIVERAVIRPAPELASIPLYVSGVNRFAETLQNIRTDLRYVWPWESEVGPHSALVLDQTCGFDDSSSLKIESLGEGRSCWKATTIGPAFGGKPFVGGSRYELSAMVKTSGLAGRALIAVRLHRESQGRVFDINTYETFTSIEQLEGDRDWSVLKVITPPISPPPDRLHLLLIQEGSGTTWFDNVLLEVLS